jgi:hypothetical protein
MWLYDIATDRITDIGISAANRFIAGNPGSITQDEETSGIIEAFDIIGPGWFLLNMQAHAGLGGELVEYGQLMAAFIPQAAFCDADVTGVNNDGIRDGGVGIEDLLFYLSLFDGGDLRADLDDGTNTGQIDGGVGIEDLLYYLGRFDAGC